MRSCEGSEKEDAFLTDTISVKASRVNLLKEGCSGEFDATVELFAEEAESWVIDCACSLSLDEANPRNEQMLQTSSVVHQQ